MTDRLEEALRWVKSELESFESNSAQIRRTLVYNLTDRIDSALREGQYEGIAEIQLSRDAFAGIRDITEEPTPRLFVCDNCYRTDRLNIAPGESEDCYDCGTPMFSAKHPEGQRVLREIRSRGGKVA